jgi:predicted PurR-regulated permease PerM
MYLTPKLVGDRIGLHPVTVIFAVLAGGPACPPEVPAK